MSRCFQLIGLPDAAYAFIALLEIVEESEFVEYFYSDGYAFKTYRDNDGVEYIEYEQDCPWYAGPMLFLGLKRKDNGKIVYSWKQEQIGKYLL